MNILIIIILSLIIVGLTVLFIIQLKKTRLANAQLKQYDHAIKAFEELEGKIGELKRKYASAKNDLNQATDPVDIANILNSL